MSRTSTVTGINAQNNTFTANDWLATDSYDNNGNTTVCHGKRIINTTR